MPRQALIQLKYRRGTTAQWQSANPILSDMEPGVEFTTAGIRLIKYGDGATAWNDLPYAHFNIAQVIANPLPAAADPTVSFDPKLGKLLLGIPRGQTGATGSQGMSGTGAAGAKGDKGDTGPTGTTILGSLASAFSYASSTTETTIYSTTIPANSLGTSTAVIRMVARGYVTQSNIIGLLVAPSFTVRVKYGGQTFVALSSLQLRLALMTTASPFKMEIELMMRGASAQQQSIYSEIRQPANIGPFMLSASGGIDLQRADLTVDSTQNQTFSVTVQSTAILSTTMLVTEQIRLIRLG